MDLPGVPAELLQTLAASAGPGPIALVGGAVRDLLLHRVHQDPWRGLPDLDLVVEGLPNKLIADQLDISVRTVEVHRARVFDKMEVKSAVELANLMRQLA